MYQKLIRQVYLTSDKTTNQQMNIDEHTYREKIGKITENLKITEN